MAPLPAIPLRVVRTQREFINEVKNTAHRVLPAILRRLLPGGKLRGGEFIVCNPRRNDRTPGSFKIRATGTRAGAWSDFATGESGGDAISLAAYLDGVSQMEAARRLARLLNITENDIA